MAKLDQYQDQASAYSTFADVSFSWKHLEAPALSDHLKPYFNRKKFMWLEAGCGSGRVMKHLTNCGVDPQRITGLDQNDNLLAEAKRQNPGSTFILGDLEDVESIGRSAFDVITCCMVLENIEEPAYMKILQNISSWLSPHGIFYFIAPHPLRYVDNDLRRYFNRGSRMETSAWGTPILYTHRTVADYINGVAKIGLRVICVDEPQLSADSERDNPVDYAKYSATPSRLIVVSQKD